MPKRPSDAESILDPTDRALGAWEPTLAAPIEGGHAHPPRYAQLPVIAKPPCPSLCDYGPCLKLHTMKIMMNVAQPIDGSRGVSHHEFSRTCYPSHGIEMDLADSPIIECSHWDPNPQHELERHDLTSAHMGDVAAWEAEALAALTSEEEDLETAVSSYIADDDQPQPHEDGSNNATEGELS